ncbi:MAG: hypothetical protein ACTSUV_00310 [Candidatus Ranarchaeia archaeon]
MGKKLSDEELRKRVEDKYYNLNRKEWRIVFDGKFYRIYYLGISSYQNSFQKIGSFLESLKKKRETIVSVIPNVGTTPAAYFMSSAGVNGITVVTRKKIIIKKTHTKKRNFSWKTVFEDKNYRMYYTGISTYQTEIQRIGHFIDSLEEKQETIVSIIPNIGTTGASLLGSSAGVNGITIITKKRKP